MLGRGATGTTWLAEGPDGVQVAIKELRTSPDRKQAELLEREVRVLKELRHAGIPAYVDDFATGMGRFSSHCLVQEFVPGRTIAAIARAERFDAVRAFGLVERICEPLAYLHALAPPVVHRDLKPENILVRPDGTVAIVDFGSVRDAWKGTFGGSTVAGTFGYMAPEQFAGDASPASDVYALGALVVFLLARRDPAELRDRLQRFGWREVTQLEPRWEGVLATMLAPDPQHRPRDAAALAQALARARMGQRPHVPGEVGGVGLIYGTRVLEPDREVVVDPFQRLPMRAAEATVPGVSPAANRTLAVVLGLGALVVTALATSLVVAIVGAGWLVRPVGAGSYAVPVSTRQVELFGRSWVPGEGGDMTLVPVDLTPGEYLRMRLEFDPLLRACVPDGGVLSGQGLIDAEGRLSFDADSENDCVATLPPLPAPVDAPSGKWVFGPGMDPVGGAEAARVEVFGAGRYVAGHEVALRPRTGVRTDTLALTVEVADVPVFLSSGDARIVISSPGKHYLSGIPPGTFDVLVEDATTAAASADVPLYGASCGAHIARSTSNRGLLAVRVNCVP